MKYLINFYKKLLSLYYTFLVKRKAMGVGKGLKVNYRSSVSKGTVLGDNVNFNGMKINGGSAKIIIGNNFHSGHECNIIACYHNYNSDTSIPYDNTFIDKDVTIEDNVWIGNRVIILGGVTIGEGSIIQAASVVVNNIPKYSIAGGHPAKVFKYRDIEKYKRLKELGKFY